MLTLLLLIVSVVSIVLLVCQMQKARPGHPPDAPRGLRVVVEIRQSPERRLETADRSPGAVSGGHARMPTNRHPPAEKTPAPHRPAHGPAGRVRSNHGRLWQPTVPDRDEDATSVMATRIGDAPILKIVCGDREVDVVDELTLGRTVAGPFDLTDPKVSGRHASIRREGGAVRVIDLRSTNGTFVNGNRVTDALIEPGDVIRLGAHCQLRVRAGTA